MDKRLTKQYREALARAEKERAEGIVDTMNDAFFRYNFATPGNEYILISFLTAVFGNELKHPIQSVTFLPAEISDGKKGDKTVRFDLCCELDSGERIDIEMQVLDQHNIVKRSLVYESLLYLRGLNAGDEYADRQPAYCINILNFELSQFKENASALSVVGLCELSTKKIFSEDQKIFFLEISKFAKQLKFKETEELSPLERWMSFFVRGLSFEAREKYAAKEGAIMASIENARTFTHDEPSWLRYMDEIVHEMDLKSMRRYEREEGHREGFQEGDTERAVKVAQKLLAKKVPISEIIDLTDLPRSKIHELAAAHGLVVNES